MGKKIEWVITHDPSQIDAKAYKLHCEIDGNQAQLEQYFRTEQEARVTFATIKEEVRRKREEAGKQKEVFREAIEG